MSVHKEISFETDICCHLAAHGWLYEGGDYQRYERDKALFAPDVLAWVEETQPKAWEVLTKNHGTAAGETLLARLTGPSPCGAPSGAGARCVAAPTVWSSGLSGVAGSRADQGRTGIAWYCHFTLSWV
jgi:hypothetical protein